MNIPSFSDDLKARTCQAYGLPIDTVFQFLHIGQNSTIKVTIPGRTWPRVLRIYGAVPGKTVSVIEAEIHTMSYVALHSHLRLPKPIPNVDSDLLTVMTRQHDQPVLIAMFSFVGGNVVSRATQWRLLRLGRSLGELDRVLCEADTALDPPPSTCRRAWDASALIDWPLEQLLKSTEHFPFLQRTGRNGQLVIQDIAERLKSAFASAYHSLPCQLLHGDAHLGNVKFTQYHVGILDFDNLGYGLRIYELAAAICSPQIFSVRQSVPFASSLMAGYMEHIPLSDQELRAWPLVVAVRLFGSLGWAATNRDVSWMYEMVRNGAVRLEHIRALLDAHERKEVNPNVEPAFLGVEPYTWPLA